MSLISIIIPTYNEENYIRLTLTHVTEASTDKYVKEIIIVDGGSTDNTINIASEFKNVKVVSSPKGRAKQLNAGAKVACGKILYFLHADSFPPKCFDKLVVQAIDKGFAGCFRLKFENPSHFILRISQWATRLNFLLFRGGDQSLFIKKTAFNYINGFNENFIIYEDMEFINRIYKQFDFKIIKDYVVTSERKFIENGVFYLHFHFLMIHIKYFLGATPQQLHNYYSKYVRG